MRAVPTHPTPVSRALRVPKGDQFREIRTALASVDSTHFDGALPQIDVVCGHSMGGEDGAFDPAKRQLFVALTAANVQAAFLHELGHVVDRFGIGDSSSFATLAEPEMAGWREATIQSQRFAEWKALQKATRDPALTAYLPYHLRVWELWARSYAQYVASRANNRATLEFLLNQQTVLPTGEVLVYQWDHDDFVSIADEIEMLFQRLGWIS